MNFYQSFFQKSHKIFSRSQKDIRRRSSKDLKKILGRKNIKTKSSSYLSSKNLPKKNSEDLLTNEISWRSSLKIFMRSHSFFGISQKRFGSWVLYYLFVLFVIITCGKYFTTVCFAILEATFEINLLESQYFMLLKITMK